MAAEKIDAIELNITSKTSTENLDKLIESLGKLSSALDKVKSKNVSVNIKQTGDASNAASTNVDKLSGSFLNQAVRITALIAVYRKLTTVISDGIASSMNYVKTLNMFTVSLGEYSENATKYGNAVKDALGIDISSWQNAQGIFQTLITGFGVSGDQAAYMSQNLTQLSYDIASFYGITNEEAQNKLKSAISGRLEPIRKLGWDLSQSKLTDIAKNPKNYGKQTYSINEQTGAIEANTTAVDDNTQHKIVNFNQLTQQEKVQLRYIALMTQVTQVQGNMAKTLNDPNNQMRVFRDQLNMTSRELGNIFIPMLNKALPYLTAFAQLAGEAFKSLALLFGFELPDMKERIGDATIADPYNDIVKATGQAAKNAKKLKDYTIGIDELNVLRPDNGTGAGGGSGVGGENSNLKNLLTPGYDFLSKAVENSIKKAREEIDKFFGELKKRPLSLPIQILGLGAATLGENFWEAVLGKSPEELAQDAERHGRTIGQEFYAALAWSAANSAGDLLAHIMGVSPEELQREAEAEGKDVGEKFKEKFFEGLTNFTATGTQTGLFSYLITGNVAENQLAKRAGEAGRSVGDQFTLEFGKSCLQLFNNPVMKFIYEKATGRNLARDIESVNKALAKKKETPKEEKSLPSPLVPRSSNLNTIVSNNVGWEKQGKADANSYAKGFGSGASNTQVNANKVFKAGLNGVSDNGNGGTKFFNTSASEAQKYAQGLTSANSNAKSAGKGLFNSASKGVTEANSGSKGFKYVSYDQARQYYSGLVTKDAKTKTYNAGVTMSNQGSSGANSKKSSYTTAGQNAGAGFVLGIDKNKSKATTSGMTIAMNALKKLKEVLGIHSPSKAFGEAGMYSVLGYANSIQDYSYKATEAVENMARLSVKAVNSSANMFSFPGYSAPNNVGYGIGMANESSMASLASNIYQAVVSGMSSLNLNTNNGGDLKVIIDGREVFKVVQTESRKQGVAISNGAFSTN